MSDEDTHTAGRPRRGGSLWGIVRRILLLPVTIVVLIYFLLEDLFWSIFRPAFRALSAVWVFISISAWLQRLSPYAALAIFAVPFIVLEPLKIFSLLVIGSGHFVRGGVLLIVSYALSLVIVERLFHVTRDQLMTIGWFAFGYRLVMRLRDWAYARLEATGLAGLARDAARRLSAFAGGTYVRLRQQLERAIRSDR